VRGYWIAIFFCLTLFNGYSQIVKSIEIIGNSTTKKKIILRELSFSIGDTISSTDTLNHIKKSENNLFNTALFNFTKVTFKDSLNNWNVCVELQERWYIWPEVIVKFQERNFAEWWKNKNLSRVDFGLHLNKLNFLGLNQTVQLNSYLGFTESFGFQYKVPYFNEKLKDGFKIAADYSTQNEVFVDIDKDEMVYIKNDSTPIQSSLKLQLEYTRRTGFYQTQFFNLRFIRLEGWDILNPFSNSYFGNNSSSLRFINFSYRYKYDRRFSQNYPLNGYFFDVQIDQFGFGNLDQSNIFVSRLLSSYRKYWKINHKYFFAAGAFLNHYFNKNTPFYLQSGLGFSNYVRGFEPYIIYGKTSGLLKSNFKTKLLKTKPFTVPLIKKIKKFSKIYFAVYWNCFLDAGYVHLPNPSTNELANQLLLGGGSGIDWVTYYDVVIRTEYSINQFGNTNFNISFVSPL
tara:strand:- start:5829 stop:7199 length:1371 start_codon:yes stop_codon:yes gene_type:complete